MLVHCEMSCWGAWAPGRCCHLPQLSNPMHILIVSVFWRRCTAGDEGVVGVTARLATVDDEPLARVVSAQYRGMLQVVTVADMPCRERMAKLVAKHKLPVPDMLALTQSIPFRRVGMGLRTRHAGEGVAGASSAFFVDL